jgi:hypothetical protein
VAKAQTVVPQKAKTKPVASSKPPGRTSKPLESPRAKTTPVRRPQKTVEPATSLDAPIALEEETKAIETPTPTRPVEVLED